MSSQFLFGIVVGVLATGELMPYYQQILESLPHHEEVASRRLADLLALKEVAVILLGPGGPARDCFLALVFLTRLVIGFSLAFCLNTMSKGLSQWVRSVLIWWAPGAIDTDARRSGAAMHSRLLGPIIVACIFGGAVATLSISRSTPRVTTYSVPGMCAVEAMERAAASQKGRTTYSRRRSHHLRSPANQGGGNGDDGDACSYGLVDRWSDSLAMVLPGGLSGGLA